MTINVLLPPADSGTQTVTATAGHSMHFDFVILEEFSPLTITLIPSGAEGWLRMYKKIIASRIDSHYLVLHGLH